MKQNSRTHHPQHINGAAGTLDNLSAILNAMNEAVFITGTDESGGIGKFIYVNDAAARLTGYSKDELLKLTPVEIAASYSAADLKILRAELQQAGKFTKETATATKTGGKIPVEVTACLSTIDGKTVSMTFVRDITARVEGKAKLHETENLLRTQFENVLDVIYIINADFILSSISPSVERVLGYTPDECIGKAAPELLRLFQPEYHEKVTKNLARFFSGEQLPVGVYGMVTKDGRKLFAEMQGKAVFRNGKFTGWVSVLRDVTTRVTMENELKLSEEKYKYLLNNVPVGIAEVDSEKDRIKEINDIACQYVGYTREELLNMPLSSLFEKESENIRRQRIEAIRRGESVSDEFEYQFRTKSGEYKWILIHLRHRVEKGKIVHSLGIAFDISSRKLKEEKIEARLRELEGDLAEKIRELKDIKLDLLAHKGELDRTRGEHELVRLQMVENKQALATLAKNMEQIHYETENQITAKLRKVQLPVLERMRDDGMLERYRNDLDLLIRQLTEQGAPHSERARIIYALTSAELQIATQIGRGMSSREIAAYLKLSVDTVKTHRKNIRKKLGLTDSKQNLVSFLQSKL